MRRTFATLRCAVGDDPAYTAAQLGHTDARFTMRVYIGATKHRERLTAAERRAYDQAVQWALMTAAGGDAVWIVTGTYNGRPTTIRWVDGDVFGEPTVPLPLTYADATSERFHFTYPDGMVTVSFADAFSTWAFTVRLLDNPVTTNPPACPADWPARPVGRGNVA